MPQIRFVVSLENDLAVRARAAEIAVKDFSCGSYATIFNDEIRRRVKQVPLAFYKATLTCLFSVESDYFRGWLFKFKEDEGCVHVNGTGETIDNDHQDGIPAKRLGWCSFHATAP